MDTVGAIDDAVAEVQKGGVAVVDVTTSLGTIS